MAENTNHMKELLSVYYPSYNPEFSTTAPEPSKPTFTLSPKVLNLVPYQCCGITHKKYDKAKEHFFKIHFASVVYNWNNTRNPCTEYSDIGNRNIPAVYRAAFFLDSLVHLPDNPNHFRPAPHTKAPLDFANPYSSVLAMAYDYIAVVKAQPIQFIEFNQELKHHAIIKNFSAEMVCSWTCWAHFVYPGLSSQVNFVKSPYGDLLWEQQMLDMGVQRTYKCPAQTCARVYTRRENFIFHISRHHKELIGSDYEF
ncbi:hypothetical protein DSO57_1028662 [Entomophthora muscae]|uniref:Uncharacterized protein n=1 Tax=Entomophthora muscae TaxID=34485 RepID=A0ACC2RG43_9FUNG|nr:hypothetical protein DSO57_1028662 [Entomophthora muscae]